MARHEHLPIYKAALDMTVHFEKLVASFSQYHKYTLDTELREGSRAVLQQVLRANNAKDKTGPAACELALAGEVGGHMCSPTTTGPVRSTRRILTTRGTSTGRAGPTQADRPPLGDDCRAAAVKGLKCSMATRTTTTRTMRCMPWLCAPEDDAP